MSLRPRPVVTQCSLIGTRTALIPKPRGSRAPCILTRSLWIQGVTCEDRGRRPFDGVRRPSGRWPARLAAREWGLDYDSRAQTSSTCPLWLTSVGGPPGAMLNTTRPELMNAVKGAFSMNAKNQRPCASIVSEPSG